MYYSLSADKSVKYRLDSASKGTQYSWTFSWNSPCRNNLSSHGLSGLFSVMSHFFHPSCFFSSLLSYTLCSIFQPFSFEHILNWAIPVFQKGSKEKKEKKEIRIGYLFEFFFFFQKSMYFCDDLVDLSWWGHIFFSHNYFLLSKRKINRSIRVYTSCYSKCTSGECSI